eukprot:4392812-Prymnesium_polylepis.2
MTLPDLDRVYAVLKSAGELKTAFLAKADGGKFRALIGEIQPGFIVARHSSTCSSRVSDNLCVHCNVPCLAPLADYYGFVTVNDWSDPTKTFDIPFAAAGGTCLFNGRRRGHRKDRYKGSTHGHAGLAPAAGARPDHRPRRVSQGARCRLAHLRSTISVERGV